MENYKRFGKERLFLIFFIAILVVTSILRFYDYGNRFGLAYDQAHDALLARNAVKYGKIPLLGPFSSAGPFQTGGEWYWFIMIPTALYPFSALSPWIFMTLLYVFFVAIIMLFARRLEGNMFAIIVGLLAAVSTAQISQSVNLTNQSPEALISLMALWSIVEYIKTRKTKYFFWLGFLISLAISIHLQGVALVALVFVSFVVVGKSSIKKVPFLLLGAFIPAIPLLSYDFTHHFFNVRNMLQYYLHDQYKISLDVLGRRWLTYGGVFIPKSWSLIIGGDSILGYIEIIGSFLFILYSLLKNSLSKQWTIIAVSTLLMISILRYTRTPLFDSYFVFLHPFVILLTAFFVYRLFIFNKSIGIVLLVVIISVTAYRDIAELKSRENYTALMVKIFMSALSSKYPSENFSIYDRELGNRDKSLPLSLFLDAKGKIDDKGRKIGMAIVTHKVIINKPIFGDRGGYQLFDLNSSSSAELAKNNWILVNPSEIYRSTEEWYTK